MDDELLRIKNIHLAIYHALLGFISYQNILNEEVVRLIAEHKDYDLPSYRAALKVRSDSLYDELVKISFSSYGVVDLDDLLKKPLRPDEE